MHMIGKELNWLRPKGTARNLNRPSANDETNFSGTKKKETNDHKKKNQKVFLLKIFIMLFSLVFTSSPMTLGRQNTFFMEYALESNKNFES